MFSRGLLRGLLACACFVVFASPASAMPTPTTNVPYLAWLGDNLKLVQCDLRVTFEGEPIDLTGVSPSELRAAVRFTVEDWSGDPLGTPTFLGSGATPEEATLFEDADYAETGEYCAAAFATSQRPGFARIGMSASFTSPDESIDPETLALLALDPDPGAHVFPAAWMTLSAPVLVNLGGESLGTGLLSLGGAGDALNVRVTGSFPLGGSFAGLVPGDQVTLPQQWLQLAAAFAADADTTVPGSNPLLWDIHDDTTPWALHVLGTGCPTGPFGGAIEAVDTCFGGGPEGPFSQISGGPSATPAWGPYDPMRLAATALGDGKLDAGDAPLPPARVTFSIAPGGFGSLEQVSKARAYSRDGTGSSAPRNFYAPFYKSFIPATAADPAYTSGTTGPIGSEPDPFFAPYTFWERFDIGTRTGSNGCRSPLGDLYPFPNGAETVSIFTDEHGEGRVHFLPGNGLLLVADSQGRCDLGAYGTEAAGNTTPVVAVARYGQPVAGAPSLVSNSLVLQRRGERGGSSLDCVPKSAVSWTCFHRIASPDGLPLAGARVRASADPSSVRLQPNSVLAGGFDSRGQTIIETDPGERWATLATNVKGTIGFDVTYTLGGSFEVRTEEIGTRQGGPGVIRVVTLPQPPPVTDSDGDGIQDSVDPNPTTPSTNFSDSAGTSGSILASNGLTVTVSDVAGAGVSISTSGSGGPATVSACGGFMVSIATGSTITITCGSITLAVTSGSATITLGSGLATVTVPAGAAVEVEQGSGGGYSVEVLSGTVTLTVDGVTTILAPGPAVPLQTWDFDGFFPPVSAPPAHNKATAGQAIPLKWRLTDASGAAVTTLASAKISVQTLSCGLGTTADLPVEATNGGLTNLGAGSYELVWKTPKSYAKSCKVLQLDIGDGVTHTAIFDFTK